MSQSTTYTCDHCGYKSTSNTDWQQTDVSYYTKDYCPPCVKQLLKAGLEVEAATKAKCSAQSVDVNTY